MLGKLIKYEFKATGRTLLPLYGVLLVISIIYRIFFPIGVQSGIIQFTSSSLLNMLKALSFIAYITLFVAAKIVPLIVIIQRFYRNLLKDEGYLMNTLPVKPSANIISKLVTATVWCVISTIVSGISIAILALDKARLESINAKIDIIKNYEVIDIGSSFNAILIELIVITIVATIASILMMYSSILIGHLFNKHKVLLSFATFIVIDIILNILSVILVYFCQSILGGGATASLSLNIQFILISGIVNLAIFSLILFYVSCYILKNRLNLE